MANNFNISVKPEIAAAVVKIDNNKTVIDENKVILADLHDTDLPAIDTKLTTLDTVADNIRNIDVPNIQTNIDANETKIDTIDGIVDAIKLKTDATPQNVRGKLYGVFLTTAESAFQDVVNISGHGKLNKLVIAVYDAGDTIELKVTFDGTAADNVAHTGDVIQQIISINIVSGTGIALAKLPTTGADVNLFNIEFESSLLIQIRRSAGAAGNVIGYVNYTLDTF